MYLLLCLWFVQVLLLKRWVACIFSPLVVLLRCYKLSRGEVCVSSPLILHLVCRSLVPQEMSCMYFLPLCWYVEVLQGLERWALCVYTLNLAPSLQKSCSSRGELLVSSSILLDCWGVIRSREVRFMCLHPSPCTWFAEVLLLERWVACASPLHFVHIRVAPPCEFGIVGNFTWSIKVVGRQGLSLLSLGFWNVSEEVAFGGILWS